MPKAEIGWTRRDAHGQRCDVYAQRVGREWRFFVRARRYDTWQPIAEAPLEDWRELLDAVRRRAQRRRSPPEEIARVEQAIRDRFPEADL
ncbi:MAG: hypothetical protein JXQ71_02520 [Verrucomicrobia bacterium]|nr:hypothetical protein [Verrucomicrobiota bacterium]